MNFPWTFYLQPMFFMYVATDCGGSHPGNPTQEELEVFGEGRAPAPDEPFLGVLGSTMLIVAVLSAFLRLRRRQDQRDTAP